MTLLQRRIVSVDIHRKRHDGVGLFACLVADLVSGQRQVLYFIKESGVFKIPYELEQVVVARLAFKIVSIVTVLTERF